MSGGQLSGDARGELVAAVAELVETRYVFADRAVDIAAALRDGASPCPSGDPDAVARDLTGWLRTHDGHFAVAREAASGSAARPGWNAEAQRRVNYGFREVRLLPGNVAALTVTLFADLTEQARAAADAALTLCGNASALVVDLRGNGGGSPDMVRHLLARLVPEPVHVVTFVTRDGTGHEDWTPPLPPGRTPLDMPVYVLVDRGTASAAESFAYAVQSLGRGLVVGERTVGIGNPVEVFGAPHGFRVSVPVGAPLDPRTGTNWDGPGVSPDVLTSPADVLHRAHDLALA